MNLQIFNVWTCVYEATPDELSFLQHDALGVRRKGRKGMEADSLFLRYATPPMFPTGWLGPVHDKMKGHRMPMPRQVDMRRVPCVPDWSVDISWLYPHQLEAVKSLVKQDRCLLEGATGSGKGEIIPAIMRVLKTRWLLLIRGRTLMHQLADRIEKRLGEEVGKIGDGEWTVREKTSPQRVVVCMSQSMNSYWDQPNANAPGTWHPKVSALLDTFGGVVGDECFPAGTIIDGRPIEMLRAGDCVTTYDEENGLFASRRVRSTVRNVPRCMVRVRLTDGRSIACTAGHPFLTPQGWQPALALSGSAVLSMEPHATNHHGFSLREMHKAFPNLGAKSPRYAQRQNDQSLLERMSSRIEEPESQGRNAEKSGAVLDSYEDEQSDVRSTGEREGSDHSPLGRLETTNAGWQRKATTNTTATSSLPTGLEYGNTSGDETKAGVRLPNLLQDRHRQREFEDRNRSGWEITSVLDPKDAGPKERIATHYARVDHVEVLQPGSDGTFGGVCPDGYVYNFEVEDFHTYVVNGCVVHNCHGAACIQDTRILQSLHNAYYRYGFSATTTGRSDKRDEDIVSHFAPIGHEITATDMQAQGRIAKTQIYMHRVPQQNIWSYQSGGYTLGITLSPARNAKIASIWKIAQKPCLTYFKELAHGQNLKFIAEQLGHKVLLIDGSTPEEARQQSMQAMERHDVDILLGSKALREGVDLTHVRSEINGSGDKSPIGVIQQKGRGERICHDDRCQICAYYGKKTQLTLHDFYDYDPTQTGKTEKLRHWLENHSIERLRAYESRGYKVKIQ